MEPDAESTMELCKDQFDKMRDQFDIMMAQLDEIKKQCERRNERINIELEAIKKQHESNAFYAELFHIVGPCTTTSEKIRSGVPKHLLISMIKTFQHAIFKKYKRNNGTFSDFLSTFEDDDRILDDEKKLIRESLAEYERIQSDD